ncbi:MAG: hypothetical protein ACREQL_13510, partial [Candidatus Binatia bacterium]
VVVRIDGPGAPVRDALAAIPGVRAVEVIAGGTGPGATYRIVAEEPEPVQRAVAGVVVGRGWGLLEVRLDSPSLEDLFMQLVGS